MVRSLHRNAHFLFAGKLRGAVTHTKPHYFADSPAVGAITTIAKIGYSKRRHTLEIEFVNGAIYRYLDVPVTLYRELMSAESKARFYDSNIRKHYRSVLIRLRQKEQVTKSSE